jgi:hypothetical protein
MKGETMTGLGNHVKISLFIALTTIIGCAQPPRQKTADAKEALDYAESVGAGSLEAAEFQLANNAFSEALNTIVIENRKLSFLRNYDKANKLLDDAVKLAEKASESAKAYHERSQTAMENNPTGNAKTKATTHKIKISAKKKAG